jgi:hypothetical protein
MKENTLEQYSFLKFKMSGLRQSRLHKLEARLSQPCHFKPLNYYNTFILFTLILVFGSFRFQEKTIAQPINTCIKCHLELEAEYKAPAEMIINDVHQKAGLSCAGCHGGDATAEEAEQAMDPAKSFIGVPKELEIPSFCARCHSDPAFMRKYNPSLPTDQLEKYWTSQHGMLIKKGDPKVAQCVSCHSVHQIRPAADPLSTVYAQNVPQTCAKCHADSSYMAHYKIPIDQYSSYKQSVHGQALLVNNDLGAPACNDCHGNHAAIPPGVSSIGMVCYQCHLAEGELFMQSPHKAAFDQMAIMECVYCHGNHQVNKPSDEQIGGGPGSLCLQCHSEGDPGYDAAQSMKADIVSLSTKYGSAQVLIESGQRKGVELSEALFKLREVRDNLVNLRKMIHTFDSKKLHDSTIPALVNANQAYQAGQQAIAEVKSRRLGFAIFTIISLIVIVASIFKIRDMEKSDKVTR